MRTEIMEDILRLLDHKVQLNQLIGYRLERFIYRMLLKYMVARTDEGKNASKINNN